MSGAPVLRVQSPRGPIRIVLIEDNRLARDQLARVLDRQANVKVVAQAASATAGFAKVQELKPHVTLVDAALGKVEDLHACLRRAREVGPEARVIMMDVLPEREDIVGLIRAGANGFILKDATVNDVVGAIHTVAQGTAVLPRSLISALWAQITEPTAGGGMPGAPRQAASLTRREQQIAELIAEGLTNKELARHLGITVHTVKSHLHSVLHKLGLHTRLQIAAYVQRTRPERKVGLRIVD